MELTSESFIAACREGGRRVEAWLRRFDREHAASLYREAARALGSWQQAEDVVQDGMIKVWLRCSTYHGPANPLAWIRTVIRNTLMDHLAKRERETSLTDEDGELTPEAQVAVVRLSKEEGLTPERVLESGELERVFRECFERFKTDHPRHAQVLHWVVEEGLGNDDIADLLGRTPGATREFVSQCRKRGRPYFSPWYALANPNAAASLTTSVQERGDER